MVARGPVAGRGAVPGWGPVAGPPVGVVRLSDGDGLIALAEPRGDGQLLKPIVGFRQR